MNFPLRNRLVPANTFFLLDLGGLRLEVSAVAVFTRFDCKHCYNYFRDMEVRKYPNEGFFKLILSLYFPNRQGKDRR